MLSSVFLSGRIGRKLDRKTRVIELDALVPNSKGEYVVTEVPVRSSHGDETSLMRATEGNYVILKGRLGYEEGMGLFVVSEIEEYLGKRKSE